jgi:hypothetical protein
MWWLFLLLMQDVPDQAQRIRAAMQDSLEKQRVSIQNQIQTTGAAGRRLTRKSEPRPEFPCEPLAKPDADKMIEDVAAGEKIDPALLREVARQESGFYPCAVSSKGAVGLMQLMPETQAQFDVSDPTDPKESLAAGAKLLKELLEHYGGDLKLALSAYNAGRARVDEIQDIPPIPETKHYVEEILRGLRP